MTQTPTTEPITDAEIAAIRSGLQGVTPGPWETGEEGEIERLPGHTPIHGEGWGAFCCFVTRMEGDRSAGGSLPGHANLAHVLRLDPQTVARLLARLESAEEIVRLYVDPGDVRPEHNALVNAIQWRQQ